uniref:Uncharacterized protein n=1 Tax=Pseudonaja textilis TaxID=8673 RepID=A0A670ZL44_PSETE
YLHPHRAKSQETLLYLLCIFPNMIVPSIIYMETTENFCVQINNLNEILNLTLLLDSEVLNQVTVKEKDVFQCIPFQVVAFTILELTGNGLTQSFENRKRVRIEKPKHLVFIQADKTIYRAGQEASSDLQVFNPIFPSFTLMFVLQLFIRAVPFFDQLLPFWHSLLFFILQDCHF